MIRYEIIREVAPRYKKHKGGWAKQFMEGSNLIVCLKEESTKETSFSKVCGTTIHLVLDRRNDRAAGESLRWFN